MIIVRNKRCSQEKLKKEFPGCIIIDVTSKGEGEWQNLSPFYPHGDIPIPFTENITSMSVEGIWQGLKVFENGDIDKSSFRNGTMKGIKRTGKSLPMTPYLKTGLSCLPEHLIEMDPVNQGLDQEITAPDN